MFIKNFNAGAVLPKYCAVKFDADGNIVPAAAATDAAAGVTTNVDAVAGERCDVQMWGEGFVIAGGAFVPGDLLVADTDGKVVAASGAGRTIGMALESASADGDQVRAFIFVGCTSA